MNAIETHNLIKDFDGVRAVDDLSIAIPDGKIIGLLGPNGAGKTTTIQMILDLITPTSGTIKILGMEMKRNREEILHKINFSSPYVALPGNLTVLENLSTFARLYGVKNIREKINDLADFFAIREFLSKKTASLSTGQLARLNLTKALLNDPKILLLDEPTSSLDPDIADRTRKLLKKIKNERGLTILYTSHNMVEIEELCDSVIFINNGRLEAQGTSQELVKKFGRKDLNDVFLAIARNHEQ